MKPQNKVLISKLLGFAFFILLIFSFLISGINLDVQNIMHITIIASIILGFLAILVTGKELKIPTHFIPLLFFTVVLQVYWIFTKDRINPFYYSLLFTEGLALWFVVFNLDKNITKHFYLLFLFPTVLYSLLYFFSISLNVSLTKLAYLFFLPDAALKHQQIGGLWAIVLAFLVGNGFKKDKIVHYLIAIPFGVYFLVISEARSAYVALFATIVLIFSKKNVLKWVFYALSALVVILFIYKGVSRSILFSRPYFFQSLLGFFRYPLGVGMGNFKIISNGFYNTGGLLGYFSDYTHNIFLEAVSGVGIFALPFLYWGYKTFVDIFKDVEKKNLAWLCVFLTLSVIFMFDLTYFISGMFWLWFVALGVFQKGVQKTN